MRIEWSPHALSDLKATSEYIEQDRSLEAANRITRTIYGAIQSLRNMPRLDRPGLVEGTRELVVSALPYIVVYRHRRSVSWCSTSCKASKGGRESLYRALVLLPDGRSGRCVIKFMREAVLTALGLPYINGGATYPQTAIEDGPHRYARSSGSENRPDRGRVL